MLEVERLIDWNAGNQDSTDGSVVDHVSTLNPKL
jgi:hypothetical protein